MELFKWNDVDEFLNIGGVSASVWDNYQFQRDFGRFADAIYLTSP